MYIRHINILYLCNIAVFSFLITGCLTTQSSNAQQPDWINTEPSAYPNSKFISATGSASNAEVAKDRALANLTKVFELHIRESSTTKQEVQSVREDGKESVQTTQSLSQNIDVHTDKIVDGARVAEQWQNQSDLTFHALAVLDRQQASTNIRGEIRRIDEETDFELKSINSKQDALQVVAVYQRAVALQAERDALQKTLKVIDVTGRGMSSQWNRAELSQYLETSLANLKMKPDIISDTLGGLLDILKGAMASAGFPESSIQSNAFILSSGIKTQQPFIQSGWYWLRGTLTITLSAPDGQIRGNKTWPLKVSASSQEHLKQRMRKEIDKLLKRELKATVLAFSST